MDPNDEVDTLHDLSHFRFKNVEILLKNGKRIEGQFVNFHVKQGGMVDQYPMNEYCFLPVDHSQEYWSIHTLKNGLFDEVPTCIEFFEFAELSEIIIRVN